MQHLMKETWRHFNQMPDIVHGYKIFLIKGYERINTSHIILGLYYLNDQNVKNYEVYHILINH